MGGEGSEEDRDRARRNESERREGKKKTREKTRGGQKRKGREKRKKDRRKNNQEEEKRKRQVRGVKRQQPKPELGQAGASGEELGEQECQAEVQKGHGSHHQRVGSSLERWGKMQSQCLRTGSSDGSHQIGRAHV